MRPPRGTAASFRIPVLLLGCALAWPLAAQPARPAGPLAVSVDALGLAPPDPPAALDPALERATPAGVTPPGASKAVPVRTAVSGAADPDAVLRAYAPVRPRAERPLAPMPKPLVRPASEPSTATASATPAPASTGTLGPAPAQAPTSAAPPAAVPGLRLGRGAPDDLPVLPVPVLPVPVEAPPAPVGAAPADVTARSAEVADALDKALADFVGAEPGPVGGRVNAADLARFKERQAVAAFYAGRAHAPLWIEDGHFDSRARAVLARIDHAAEDGLDLRAFPVPVPSRADDPAALAAAELALTRAAVAYGRQASGGRVDPASLGPLVAAKPDVADAARVLSALAEAPDAGDALLAFNPPQKGYAALRAKLAELRRTSVGADGGPIPYGPILKPGMRDARVPLIRARFGLDMPSGEDADRTGLVYDTQVAAAVADFQRAHHLPPSGVLTIRTVAALSGGNPRRLEGEIVANMERWRWLPRDMGENRIEVNIPDFTLNVLHGDAVVHHTRVVVGQVDKPTPVFSETMQFVIVNPYWNVPLSIVKTEMMPRLAANPNYFADHGYEVVQRGGVTYVRQPPGEGNALGRIKFMFPNKYSVYLHDTNARALFGKEQRALSHGCVRVEAPFKLAEAVLGQGWSEARVKKLVGGGERTINLPAPLPIHIVYFTAYVDEAGQLQVRDDVYGYSAKLRAALGLAG